jgi:hypothetical protein
VLLGSGWHRKKCRKEECKGESSGVPSYAFTPFIEIELVAGKEPTRVKVAFSSPLCS